MKYVAILALAYSVVVSAGSGRKTDSTTKSEYVQEIESRVAKIEVALPDIKNKRDAAVTEDRRKYLSDRVDDLQDRIEDIRVDIREVRTESDEPTADTKQKINRKVAELESLYQTKAD